MNWNRDKCSIKILFIIFGILIIIIMIPLIIQPHIQVNQSKSLDEIVHLFKSP